MSVENYEESEMVPSLQTSNLACHTFIDAGRIYETPGSEINDSLSLDKNCSSQSIQHALYWFLEPQSGRERQKSAPAMCLQERNFEFREIALCSKKKTVSPKAACYMFSKMWGI